MYQWKTLDKPEIMTHNPDYFLVGMWIHDREIESCVHAVYSIAKDRTNEGLELYYHPLHRSGTSIDASLHFYKSVCYKANKIPKKWKQVFEQLRSVHLGNLQ